MRHMTQGHTKKASHWWAFDRCNFVGWRWYEEKEPARRPALRNRPIAAYEPYCWRAAAPTPLHASDTSLPGNSPEAKPASWHEKRPAVISVSRPARAH